MAADAQHVLAEGASGHLGDDEVRAGSDRREVGRQGPSRQPGPGNQGRKSEQAWSVTRTESLPRPVDSESQAGPGRETQGHGGQEGTPRGGPRGLRKTKVSHERYLQRTGHIGTPRGQASLHVLSRRRLKLLNENCFCPEPLTHPVRAPRRQREVPGGSAVAPAPDRGTGWNAA